MTQSSVWKKRYPPERGCLLPQDVHTPPSKVPPQVHVICFDFDIMVTP